MDVIRPLPFAVNREQTIPLSLQIADGVSRAIRSGYYPSGTRLPSMDDMATELKVGRQTVHGAVRELVNRGEVVARRKAGILVTENSEAVFRGQLVHLRNACNTYYFNCFNNRLQQVLSAARYRVFPIDLTREEGKAGMPHLHSTLAGNAIDLAIIGAHPDILVDRCLQYGVRSVTYGEPNGDRRVLMHHRLDETAALTELVAQARTRSVRTIGLLSTSPARDIALFHAHGLATVAMAPEVTTDGGSPEAMERLGLARIQSFLATGAALPDLIYFADDYLARGGITALLSAGIRIPEDLFVAVHTNKGHAPVLSVPLTQVQCDPLAVADSLAAAVVQQLAYGSPPGDAVIVHATYIPGATL